MQWQYPAKGLAMGAAAKPNPALSEFGTLGRRDMTTECMDVSAVGPTRQF